MDSIMYANASGGVCQLRFYGEVTAAATLTVCDSIAWLMVINTTDVALVKQIKGNPQQEIVLSVNVFSGQSSTVSLSAHDFVTTLGVSSNTIYYTYRSKGETSSHLYPDYALNVHIRAPVPEFNVPWTRQFYTLRSSNVVLYTKSSFANDSAAVYSLTPGFERLFDVNGVPVALYESSSPGNFALVSCKKIQQCLISIQTDSKRDYLVGQFLGGGFASNNTFVYFAEFGGQFQLRNITLQPEETSSNFISTPLCHRDQSYSPILRSFSPSRRNADGAFFFLIPSVIPEVEIFVPGSDPFRVQLPTQLRLRHAPMRIVGATSSHVAFIAPENNNATQVQVLQSGFSRFQTHQTEYFDECRSLRIGYGGFTTLSSSAHGQVLLASVFNSSATDAYTLVIIPSSENRFAAFMKKDDDTTVSGAFLQYATRPALGPSYFQSNSPIFFQTVTFNSQRRLEQLNTFTLTVNSASLSESQPHRALVAMC